ncbi:MAG: ParA family protein, partial [Chloroflexi bacterium]|nr:ParA family protein [Chloroflexota bacterium]
MPEGVVMVLAVASMKGGVGKSTLSAMLARFIVEHRRKPVTVVDLDPQRGATILLLGAEYARQTAGPGVHEILASEADSIPSTELFHQALKTSPQDLVSRFDLQESDLKDGRLVLRARDGFRHWAARGIVVTDVKSEHDGTTDGNIVVHLDHMIQVKVRVEA